MDGKFLAALLVSQSTCLANVSNKLDFLHVLLHLSGLEQKEVGIPVESFPEGCRNYSYVSRRSFWEEIYFMEE